jgi:hypothetical protein
MRPVKHLLPVGLLAGVQPENARHQKKYAYKPPKMDDGPVMDEQNDGQQTDAAQQEIRPSRFLREYSKQNRFQQDPNRQQKAIPTTRLTNDHFQDFFHLLHHTSREST